MNRIILIGNGFDLANDYKTSYNNFIVWYLKEILYYVFRDHNKLYSDKLCKIEVLLGKYEILPEEKMKKWEAKDAIEYFEYLKTKSDFYKIEFSSFLSEIIKSVETKGWVDIENDYYNLLCKYISNKAEYDVKRLNACLDFVKEKLIEYLEGIVKEQKEIHQEIQNKIFEPFKENDIAVKAMDTWKRFLIERKDSNDAFFESKYDLYKRDKSNLKNDIFNYKSMVKSYLYSWKEYKNNDTNLSYPNNIMFLNFNYTDIADRYLLKKDSHFPLIYIHGKLDDPESVIFGYGDELDEKYRKIQEKNKNEYLTNIKSIKYLESDNYRRVLSFVESDYFQVYVMGHSCGNSDRTLLNTLFEHEHCVSIKPFYYVDKKKGKDNYLDIVQNISRNFTDMKLMRDRVVNKQFCEQLKN